MHHRQRTLGAKDRTWGPSAWTPTITAALACVAVWSACPKPPSPKEAKPAVTRSEQFPWLLWSRRTDRPMMVVLATKRRLLAVEYDKVPSDPKAKTVGLAGLEPDSGEVLWHRDMALKLEDPTAPWSVNIARQGRVLAVWQADGSLMGIDLYTGKDFWEKPRPKSLGVSTLGFGFVTLWKNKVFFLKPESGKTDKTFDLPADATWPARIGPEGQLYVLCGTQLTEVDVNSGKIAWTKKLPLADVQPPARLDVFQDRLAVTYRTLERVDTTNFLRVDPTTLKPRWMAAVAGRIRTHGALAIHRTGGYFLIEDAFGGQHWVSLDLAKGRIGGTFPARRLGKCTFGDKLIYCPYKNKSGTGIEAVDATTWKRQWKWETISDVSGRQHLWQDGRFYLAGDGKVVVLDRAGTTVMTAKVVWPGTSLQVNRILGIVKGVMVVTAVDWSQAGGIGELWGIDAATGARKWRKRLAGAIFTTESVALVDSKVFVMDHKGIMVFRAPNGRLSDRWPNRLAGKPTQPPKLRIAAPYAFATRNNRLAIYRLSDARPLWTIQLPVATRVLGAAAGMVVVRKPDGSIQAWDLKTGKTSWTRPWKDPADPMVTAVQGKNLLLAGPRGSVIVDPKTGKKKSDQMAVRHLVTLPGGDLLAASVARRIPTNGQILTVLGITRTADGTKVTELWHKGFVRSADRPWGTKWIAVAGDQMLYRAADDGCVHALSGDDGSETWRVCGMELTSPPLRYKTSLYFATGAMDPNKPRDKQGLFALDPDNGKTKLVYKFPGRSNKPGRFMLTPFGRIRNGVLYLLTDGLRLRAVKVAK